MIEAIENFKSVVAEERWVQGSWHESRNGKDYLCLAAAFGKPGQINSTEQCPVGLFPQWLFELMPKMDDGIALKDVPWLFRGFAERVDKMATLSPEAWERIRIEFSISNIRLALREAYKAQPSPVPAYWQPVAEACEQVIEGLHGNGDLDAAARAAYAAARAAYADAAARAAYADAYVDAAAAAADVAAYAARAARAAWKEIAARAAWKEIAESLFAEIDKEIAQ